MADTEFSVSADVGGPRYEVPFLLVGTAFFVGSFLWAAYLLLLPRVHGNLNNLAGVGILVVVFLVLLVVFVCQTWRLAFEVKGATVRGNDLRIAYRYLRERNVHLPYAARVKRGIRLLDFRNDKGYRFAHIASRGLFDRVTIPTEMDRSEELAQLLERT